jgi:hypothetical protein
MQILFNFPSLVSLSLIGVLLFITSGSSPAQMLRFEENKDRISLFEGTKHIYSYQKTTLSHDGQYPRANYIHPLNNFHGSEITEDFPADHYHHRGIFWSWHQLYIDGKQVADPWECRNVTWEVKETKFKATDSTGTLNSEIGWLIGASEPVHEKLMITYRSHPGYFVLDFNITLTSRTNNLEIGGSDDIKGYGGFSPRFKLGTPITFFSLNGDVEPQNTMVQAGDWIGMRGVGDDNTTVAIMYHPESTASLQGWILRSKLSMQNAVWPGRTRAKLDKGDSVDLKARIVVFENAPMLREIQDIFDKYVQ